MQVKRSTSVSGVPAEISRRENTKSVSTNKGVISLKKLLSFTKQISSNKSGRSTLVPPNSKASVRAPSSKASSAQPALEAWQIELNESEKSAMAELSRRAAEQLKDAEQSSHAAPAPQPEEESYTGTTVIKDDSSEVATPASDGPDFRNRKMAEESADKYLAKKSGPDRPADWHIQNPVADPNAVFALITGKGVDGVERGVTPFSIYGPAHPSHLKEAPVGIAVRNIAREAASEVLGDLAASKPKHVLNREAECQVLRRKAHTRGLIFPKNDNQSARQEAALKRSPHLIPREAPPSYAEAMGVQHASTPLSLDAIEKLPSKLNPVKHRQALLVLARNVASQLLSAPANTNLSAIRDICYEMIRELEKTHPDLSRTSCNWLVDRAKELAKGGIVLKTRGR